jgi:hypothetical protein
MFRTLGALGMLHAFRALGALDFLLPLRTLDLRHPLGAIGMVLALRPFHAVFAAVLAPIGPAVLLPHVAGAVCLPVCLAVLLPVSAAIFLADVRLRDGGGGAAQGQ